MEGVVNVVVPVPPDRTVPPEAAAYQSIVSPAPGVADIVTVPVPQRDAGTAVGAAGSGFWVTVTAEEVTVQPLAVTLTE